MAPVRGCCGVAATSIATLPSRAVGRQPVRPGGVAQPDPHLLLLRWGVAERLQPCRGARAAAAGIDDEVGVQQLVGAAVGATEHPHPGDAVTLRGGDQSDDVAAVEEPDVGEGSHPGPDVVLQEWSAGAQRASVRCVPVRAGDR